MSNVFHIVTGVYRESVHTPDYSSDPDWLINPDTPKCERKYWTADGQAVVEMDAAEKAVVDAADADRGELVTRAAMIDQRARDLAEADLIRTGDLLEAQV